MRIYRKCPKTGFIESINTIGSFKPKGWSTSIHSTKRKDNDKI